jgi:excisionase family DNA binding protein
MATATLSPGDLLSRTEAASLLALKPQTLALWASTGRYHLPYIRVGRSVRYRRSDLERFLADRTVGEFTDNGE